jgi:hypothetical protein
MSNKKGLYITIALFILYIILSIIIKMPSGIQEKVCFRYYDASGNWEIIKDGAYYNNNCQQFHK